MRLIFETHATSLDNEAGLASGWFDVDLSPLGERQARELGERRREDRIDAVYSSDLTRAARTASIAFGGSGVPIHRDARLRECDYGSLTRRPAVDIDALREAAVSTPFPGGESYEQATARVRDWLETVLAVKREGTIVAIGHRATWYALEHLIGGMPLRDVVVGTWRWQPGWIYEVRR